MNKVINGMKMLFRKLSDPTMWKNLPGRLVRFSKVSIQATGEFASFFILLIFFIIFKITGGLRRLPFGIIILNFIHKIWAMKAESIVGRLTKWLDKSSESSVKRSYLIGLSYKNLMSKKTRTFVTILGMSIGVGIIVLLLSLGYGIERLIIGRIARLDELKMVDVATGSNTALRLDNDLVEKIKGMGKIDAIMPLVSFVGKVDFNNAKTDVLVYSTAEIYLKNTNVRLLRGKYFSSKITELHTDKDVAGVSDVMKSAQFGEPVSKSKIQFSISPAGKTYAWENCSNTSKIIGMVRTVESGYTGFEYWGDVYATSGNQEANDVEGKRKLQTWVKAEVPIFYETYNGSFLPKLGDNGRQVWREVCIQKNEIVIEESNVLGESTEFVLEETTTASNSAAAVADSDNNISSESASLAGELVIATDEAGMEVVSFASQKENKKQEIIRFNNNGVYDAVVSNAFLTLLNIPLNKSLGTSFGSSFVLTKSIVPSIEGKATTEEKQFKIVGVIDDDESAYFYIPLDNAASLNIKNYSQLKIVLASKDSMLTVRKQVEVLGFRTSSAVDTVSQIESLFANLRIMLALIGLVALGVASLGMFNTLTVSLLERTREIGGMKTIGMVSKEVRDLFLAEAMILGMAGGFGGLFLGFAAGKVLSIIVSLVAITNGEGLLDLTYIPFSLVVIIVISSFIVGLVTGFYPAYRARKISALNALRYE